MLRLLILLAFAIPSLAAVVIPRDRYVVAFYNVENLFDTINDPHTAD